MATQAQWIGKRVAHFRDLRGFSQEHLANLVNVSQPRICNVEAGVKPITERTLLDNIADALRVPKTLLIGLPVPPTTRADLLTVATVKDIRAALSQPDEPARIRRSLNELTSVARAVMVARMECDYGVLGAALAPLIAESREMYTERMSPTAGRILVRALVTAALTLKPLGWEDLAMRCAEMARTVAAETGDRDAFGAAEFTLAQCVLASGNRKHSYALASTAALTLGRENGRSAASLDGNAAVAWEGLLHLHAGFSAASLGRTDDVDTHHREAERLAEMVSGNPWAMEFTIPNCRTWRVGAALENGTPERAPELAARVDRTKLRTRQRVSRLHMDTGRGHYLAGNSPRAVRAFLQAHQVARTELRTHPSVVEIIGQMWRDAAPSPASDLERLAQLVGVSESV